MLSLDLIRHPLTPSPFLDLGRCLRDRAAEGYLELLLEALEVGIRFDPYLRRSAAGFQGSYRIHTQNDAVDVMVEFDDGQVRVGPGEPGAADAELRFRDREALMRFFTSVNPDLFSSLLNQDVVLTGNLTYVYRLAYLARHLELTVLGRL
jgi:hypothetical protein